ncbi:MAG: sensor histidine kinase [Geminicoccaceae bacterium]|nr:sensor histidine kinase [Geminicoccaceae bacterium]
MRFHLQAPFGDDADLLARAIAGQGLDAGPCNVSLDILMDDLAGHDGVLVCTQEGLTRALADALEELLAAQPDWAQLPILLILDRAVVDGGVQTMLRSIWANGHLVILHRPLVPVELEVAVRDAAGTRSRQLDIRDHIARQEALRGELDHRMQNTLATFLAVYRLSIRQSDTLEQFKQSFDARIGALRMVHDALRSQEEGRTVRDMIELVLAPFGGGSSDRIHLSGPDLDVPRRSAATLALMLNEMATNALKYGALSVPTGTLSIDWSGEGGALTIEWREKGGPPVQPPTRTGYGSQFIRSGAMSLGGAVAFDFAATGLRCTLTLPAPRKA